MDLFPAARRRTDVLTAYRLPDDELVSVANGGPSDTVPRLLAATRSSRLILLRAVLDRTAHAAASGGPADTARAWQLLAAAEDRNRAVVRTLLDHPEIGIWAAYTLRRLNTEQADDTPLWVDIGHLHTIAATAAILTGLPCRTTVPLREGRVVLPTLGMATLPGTGRWRVAEVSNGPSGALITADGSTVRVPADPAEEGAGWQPMRRLRLGAPDHELVVWLDDLDPYRGFFQPLPPHRLDRTERAEWESRLARSWSLLVRHHPVTAARLRTAMTVVVPAGRARNPFRPWSSSCADGFGCASITLPGNAAVLAAMLVHELRHNILNALLDLVPLHQDDWQERYYAPWRDDPRPIGGLLHGCYSFLGVTDFWRTRRWRAPAAETAGAHFEFALRYAQVRAAVRTLAEAEQLTEPGRKFVAELGVVVRGWLPDTGSVPPRIADLARRAIADHRATWRLRHLRPTPSAVDHLVNSWLGKATPDLGRLADSTVRPDPANPNEPRARTHLAQLLLGNPLLFKRIRASPATVDKYVPGATEADLLLVDGDPAAAASAYRAGIADHPSPVSDWIGLALALAADHHPAGGALLHHPELIRAVHAELASTGTPPPPEALATWLATARG